MRVVSQLIHLLSAVGLVRFDQDRMMYATLRAIFKNIFVNREVHDKERSDHVLDLINLERLKQLKQIFWQQVFDRLNRNRCIKHIRHLLYSITVQSILRHYLCHNQKVTKLMAKPLFINRAALIEKDISKTTHSSCSIQAP